MGYFNLNTFVFFAEFGILRILKGVVLIWYVLYCTKNQKDVVIDPYRQNLSQKAVQDIFVFSYERKRKYQGAWHQEIMPMFPGYIFLESDNEHLLSEELDKYRNLVKGLTKVFPEEEILLKELCGFDHHMNMSRGIIRDGVTHVTDGPLKGREQLIRKIDRHKRIALLETSLTHRPVNVWTGLEIISKN